MTSSETPSFEFSQHLHEWLEEHHATKQELWIRIYKKESGTPSVTWKDCVISAIAWGWIDGQRKSLDEISFLQRITPRRAKSGWSKINCGHAEQLIADGLMQTSGLAHVLAAKEDGRWDKAYAGSSDMEIPEDFLEELEKNPDAKRFYETLNRRNLFAIYYRLHTAKREETRRKRIAIMIEQLAKNVPVV